MKACMAIVFLVLTACSTNPPARYMKEYATRDEFYEMVYLCKEKTVYTVSGEINDGYGNVKPAKKAVYCDKFNACMAAKGFTKSADGRFVVKNDDDINCKL